MGVYTVLFGAFKCVAGNTVHLHYCSCSYDSFDIWFGDAASDSCQVIEQDSLKCTSCTVQYESGMDIESPSPPVNVPGVHHRKSTIRR